MPRHPSANFEIQKYNKNESRFNGVYSGDKQYVLQLPRTSSHLYPFFPSKNRLLKVPILKIT